MSSGHSNQLPPFWHQVNLAENAGAMLAYGRSMAKDLPLNSCLALSGDLGMGKTTFAKGFAEGISIKTTVKSPTFQYMIVYEAPDRLFIHLDAYRMKGEDDYESLYLEDLLIEPWTLLVEWPENVIQWLPKPIYHLQLSSSFNDSRSISLL